MAAGAQSRPGGALPLAGLTVLTLEQAVAAPYCSSRLAVMGETGLLETFMGVPDTPENRAKFVATIPLGRLSTARDVANAALYLASDEADFITGVELPVDGGRTV